jgi:hypothetical protein
MQQADAFQHQLVEWAVPGFNRGPNDFQSVDSHSKPLENLAIQHFPASESTKTVPDPVATVPNGTPDLGAFLVMLATLTPQQKAAVAVLLTAGSTPQPPAPTTTTDLGDTCPLDKPSKQG